MQKSLLSIGHLLLATAFLEIGSGLQGVLIPIRAQLEGFSTQAIGLLGTAYYVGLVFGCFMVPALVRRVGHIRAFAGFAALAAAAFLVQGMVLLVIIWLGLRIAIGFCFAGLYMAVESWLNDQASTETRGRILASYMVIGWVAVIGGKLIFAWSDPREFLPFALVSIGICFAVVPVAFTTGSAPAPAPRSRLRLKGLYAISPVGLVGCLGVGVANGAFWSLAPLYAGERGMSNIHIGLFMSAAVLGGALTQWPLGKWSDRTDRRHIIVLACLVAAVAAGALVTRDASDENVVLLLAFLFGASALPLYGLCVAHANDQAPNDSFVEVSGDLLMMFGIGAMFGPYLAALLMTAIGHGGIFAFTGTVHLTLACFAALRIRQQRPVPPSEKTTFVGIPRTTQAVLPLDPRSESSEAKKTAEENPTL